MCKIEHKPSTPCKERKKGATPVRLSFDHQVSNVMKKGVIEYAASTSSYYPLPSYTHGVDDIVVLSVAIMRIWRCVMICLVYWYRTKKQCNFDASRGCQRVSRTKKKGNGPPVYGCTIFRQYAHFSQHSPDKAERKKIQQ
jgi:hypothetical protein